MGRPGCTVFSINGDAVKQSNTGEEVGCLLPLGSILMRQRHATANYSHAQTDAFVPRQPPTVNGTTPSVSIALASSHKEFSLKILKYSYLCIRVCVFPCYLK